MAAVLEALGPVLALIVKALVSLWWEKANEPRTDTAVDASPDPALRDRLAERVRAYKDANDLGSFGRAGPTG